MPTLPPRLAALDALAHNLWFTWNPDASDLFARLDPALFLASESNPVRLLASLPPAALESAARDPRYLADLDAVSARFTQYLSARDTWFARTHPESALRVAYFSAEFALGESLPIYSGGLGVLAGDHLKSASDLGVPLVAVGLAYAEGYHRQYLDERDWQRERYPRNDFARMPMRLVRDDAGRAVSVHLELPDRALRAQIWRVDVGRVRLYLLDAEVPENAPRDRALTARLYGGDAETRILQELLLGVGGVRALARLGERANVFHMNEGHSAFLALERARALVAARGARWDDAVREVARSALFTTHTPVPAGNDSFDRARVEWYLRPFRESERIDATALLSLGAQDASQPDARFSMTVLALRTADRRNGVSALHGEVARAMWKDLWPERAVSAVPIGSITNGVHAGTWLAPETRALLVESAGDDWTREPDPSAWARARDIPDAALWRVRNELRARLVDTVRRRTKHVDALDPRALTLGFARRFATYKRATLMLRDRARLAKILGDPLRPVQIVIAGKAHPADEPAKTVLRELHEATRDPLLRGRFVFVEDYEMALARAMVSGADVWLNTPRRPLEASGTSGMKAGMNGAPNLSVLDGWWCEGYAKDTGWAIGEGDARADESAQDEADAESLYQLLEQRVVPLFYERGADGIPRGWCAMARGAIAGVGGVFNTHRMVADYTERYYVPAYDGASTPSAPR